jgi:FkbM family methyltransferase
MFADRESLRHYVGQIAFRLRLDFAALPRAVPDRYFPPDIFAMSTELAFIDGGAYDGDTIREFLAVCGGQFASITAFEPDPASFARLSAYVETLASAARDRILLVRKAIGARPGTTGFNATGDMSAAVSDESELRVPVVRIDDVVPTPAIPSIIKLDIEGQEREALLGASRLVGAGHARTAVAVYHHPTDLWELPLMIGELQPAGAVYLRTHGHDGIEVICYGLPSTTGSSSAGRVLHSVPG